MKAYDRVNPRPKNKRFKIYYATQLGVKPIRIGLFVNDPKCLPDAYREYLVDAMRKTFGLFGAPVVFIPKERSRAQFVAKPNNSTVFADTCSPQWVISKRHIIRILTYTLLSNIIKQNSPN